MWILTEKGVLVNTDHILYFDVAPMDNAHILWANLNMTSLAIRTYPTEVKARQALAQIANSLQWDNGEPVLRATVLNGFGEENNDGT